MQIHASEAGGRRVSLNEPDISDGVLLDGGWRSPSRAKEVWDARRRAEFLLRDVEFPVSWDKRVLPPTTGDAPRSGDLEILALILPDANTTKTLAAWCVGAALAMLPKRAFEWRVVGYDVCDEVGCSGLSNCALSDPSARGRHARKWAPTLNSFHLFDELSRANEYRSELNVLMPEHAPFLVHRLYASLRRSPASDGQ